MKILKWISLSFLLVTALTLGGIFVLTVYNKLFGIIDNDLIYSGTKTGLLAWVFLNVAKLFSISGKKKSESY